MTDEERLLLANRERLLARSDWLGLSAARPLRMKFPAASDKENVGKRRKVHKSKNHKAKPARQRSHTPLFRQELRPRGATLSNDGQDADMNIKIGTDAFATQTQTSRRSHTPANTSMRQPSTEFGPISEEPMLLGVDGDGFDLKTDQSWPLQNVHGADTIPHAEFEGPSYDFEAPTVSMAPTFQLSQDSEPMSTVASHDHLQRYHTTAESSHQVPANIGHQFDGGDATEENEDVLNDGLLHAFNTRAAGTIAEQNGSEDDDDETFRTLMKADATLSGKSSMAAVASSSLRASVQAAPFATYPQQQEQRLPLGYSFVHQHDILVPRNDSVVAQRAETTMSEQFGPTETATSIAFGSPSNSLRQLYRTTSRPTEVTQMPPEAPNEDDEEALWRSIYLRSQSSDSGTSDLAETVQKTWVAQSDDAIEPANYSSSSKAKTEKVLSDKATFGGSILADRQGSGHDSQLDKDAESRSSQHQSNTSMVGHATTVAAEPDDIDNDEEEDHQAPRSFTTGNIHASSTMSSDYHKRFLKHKRSKSTRSAFSKPPRFEPAKVKGRPRQEASTYV
ncbi:hypothetical protein CLAFUW4_00561 [Fulvia fulva]|nr:hypothetical protein CLAFUR4_00562 [Fulvia fulva]WPV08530.1 hypothetical protein CLAFUW4_00561 [Fulvia fulva]WPV24869.1 hypothetical protein CLAFUW7_00566 [Fulvia fulva]